MENERMKFELQLVIKNEHKAWSRFFFAFKWNNIKFKRWFSCATQIHTHTQASISFPFYNDADVIGMAFNSISFAAPLLAFRRLLFCWLYWLLSNIYKLSYAAKSQNVRDALFFSFLYIHADAYLCAFNSAYLVLVSFSFAFLFYSFAEMSVSMQILSKFAVNYVLCIFIS